MGERYPGCSPDSDVSDDSEPPEPPEPPARSATVHRDSTSGNLVETDMMNFDNREWSTERKTNRNIKVRELASERRGREVEGWGGEVKQKKIDKSEKRATKPSESSSGELVFSFV